MDPTNLKFENSPVESLADSFVSTPGTTYPPLFNDVTPQDVMTPRSYDDDSMFGDSVAGTPAPSSEKKPVKKRKSWGQQLPEPKTNLPPRKRAKTEDEKEQRRVERVLRNRRAAQSSRERKRQEVEALEAEKHDIERQNADLQMRLANAEAHNALLQAQLDKLGAGGNMKVFRGSQPSTPAGTDVFQQASPITFSQDLFGSADGGERPISTQSIINPLPQTVNPASLSPEIRAVDESSNVSSSNLTQHPAALLCDLQCQLEEQRPWTHSAIISQILAMTFFLSMTSQVTSKILKPLSQIISCLTTRSPLSSTSSVLTLVMWIATSPITLMTSSVPSSTTTTNSKVKYSVRISFLRRLLACSPNLARPLMDATMVAMRSAFEQQLPACLSSTEADRLGSTEGPSAYALMTLAWAIRTIEREREQKLMAPEPDAVMEVRQVVEDLLKVRKVSGKAVCFTSQASGVVWSGNGQKSLDVPRRDILGRREYGVQE